MQRVNETMENLSRPKNFARFQVITYSTFYDYLNTYKIAI